MIVRKYSCRLGKLYFQFNDALRDSQMPPYWVRFAWHSSEPGAAASYLIAWSVRASEHGKLLGGGLVPYDSAVSVAADCAWQDFLRQNPADVPANF